MVSNRRTSENSGENIQSVANATTKVYRYETMVTNRKDRNTAVNSVYFTSSIRSLPSEESSTSIGSADSFSVRRHWNRCFPLSSMVFCVCIQAELNPSLTTRERPYRTTTVRTRSTAGASATSSSKTYFSKNADKSGKDVVAILSAKYRKIIHLLDSSTSFHE